MRISENETAQSHVTIILMAKIPTLQYYSMPVTAVKTTYLLPLFSLSLGPAVSELSLIRICDIGCNFWMVAGYLNVAGPVPHSSSRGRCSFTQVIPSRLLRHSRQRSVFILNLYLTMVIYNVA